MTTVIRTPEQMKAWRKKLDPNQRVGFVPTMGALHQGHAELLRTSRRESDVLVLSIFVNPTQFNDPNDLAKYPKTWESDLEMAQQLGVDVIFSPEFSTMYPDNFRFVLSEREFSKDLCGKDRPGHFDGVLSVVMKLFQIVQPTKAYFGEKDFQQLHLIQDMTKAFFLDTQVVPVPTVREADGLAMSSRNVRLTVEQRERAPMIYKTIRTAKTAEEAKLVLTQCGFSVDYVTDAHGRRFVAAKLGEVRLIDNVELK